MRLMRTPDEWVRLLASEKSRASAEQALADALISADQALRISTAHHLMEALPDASDDTRGVILFLLQMGWEPKLQRDAVHAVEAVLGALQRAPDGALAEADDATLILAQAARFEATQREVLLASLDRPESLVRRAAAGALGRAGPLSASVVERLAKCLTDDEPEVAEAALQSVAAVTADLAALVLPSLATYASICDGAEQYGALAALHGLLEAAPDAAGPAVPVDELLSALERALSAPDPALRLEAAGVMGLLGRPQVAKTLTAKLEDVDPDVRAAVAVALLRLGPSEPAGAALYRLLQAADPAEHGAALTALERVDAATLSRLKPEVREAFRGRR